MVRLLSTLVLAATVTFSLGAVTTDLPRCARTCFADTEVETTPRLCSSDTYLSGIRSCIDLLCLDAGDFADGIQHVREVCTDILASASASLSSTSTTTGRGSLSNSGTQTTSRSTISAASISSPSPTPISTSTTPSSTSTTPITPIPRPSSTSTSRSSTTNPGVSTANEGQSSTDQGNTQKYAAIGGALGALALIGIIIIVLVVIRRRKRMAAQDEKRFSEYAGQEVGSPSAVPRPWGITPHPTYTHSESEQSWATNKDYYAGNTAAWHQAAANTHYNTWGGVGPGMQEKGMPIGGDVGYGYGAYGVPPATGPRHPALMGHQQQAMHPEEDYHSIGSNFLRNP